MWRLMGAVVVAVAMEDEEVDDGMPLDSMPPVCIPPAHQASADSPDPLQDPQAYEAWRERILQFSSSLRDSG